MSEAGPPRRKTRATPENAALRSLVKAGILHGMESSPEATAERLNDVEVRVLGCLVEKSYTTPDYYPMTVNSIVTAANQKSSRFPVADFDEETVRLTLDTLREKRWATLVRTAGARTLKYRHEIRHEFNFSDHDVAVLGVLMLRGPQTLGELRARTERMARFEEVSLVEETVRELMTSYPRPFVKELPRAAGKKDRRFMHLLAGDEAPAFEAPVQVVHDAAPRAAPRVSEDRVVALEEKVEGLEEAVRALREQLDGFKSQFE